MNRGPQAKTSSGEVAKQEKPEEKEVYEDAENLLSKAVDEIWDIFDDDGNGYLDPDECTSFIKHTLTEMGESPEYAEIDFLQCFPQFAPKGKGYITKKELMIFIKKVAGMETGNDANDDDEDDVIFDAPEPMK
jgi:hypothetical protein